MSESILNALVQLFALISDIHADTVISSREKNVVRSFLLRHLNKEMAERYMKIFEEYLTSYNAESVAKGTLQERKRVSLNAMRILSICEKINEELQQKQKMYVMVQLIDYISLGQEITDNELDFLRTVSDAFFIPQAEYQNIRCFIMEPADKIPEKFRVLIINNKEISEIRDIKHSFNDKLKGVITFLYIPGTNTYLMRYSGHEDLYLNGQNIFQEQTYFFDHGSSIRGAGINTVYYTEVVSLITEMAFEFRITLDANNVTFRFKNSENGIHNLNFHEESGRLVGILGGSGVGKSTTLSILNGTLKPQVGEVLINGLNLYDELDKQSLNGVIGYVPQDDLLIEDLTVFQNLYYNAKLCLNNLQEEKIIEVVNKTLIDFDLEQTRDLKVGNPLKKIISGGQRKRLNIALEMLREPTILFVDEPTSGLSSVDSETVMNLLKAQTYKGKLVIINIHQPASDIYKMFDKIMIIDKGGYQVYYGNPTEAIVYFKKHSHHANPEEDQCVQCGNVNPEQILQIIESKIVDERGRATRTRKVSPLEWAERFREYYEQRKDKAGRERQPLPGNIFSIPGLVKQSGIFFIRDVLSKLADKQYIIISLFGNPFLALLLAYFIRFSKGDFYTFSDNENIPAYLFMCVVTSLFFGLIISSDEIIKDRKILKRESFLNLSWLSYLNSKIMILFIVSAIQTILFVLIGNTILGIKGMTLSYWLVLFTTSCFSNILGLNISSAFNSVITIYILIPFIVIPQLLFSGVFVDFDKLHIGSVKSREYVPAIGNMMVPARWSFEALAVKQFRDNEFEKLFFREDMTIAKYEGYAQLLDHLEKNLKVCRDSVNKPGYQEIILANFGMLNYYFDTLSAMADMTPGTWKDSLTLDRFNPVVYKSAKAYKTRLKRYFNSFKNEAMAGKSKLEGTLKQSYLDTLRTNYVNNQLKFLVLNEGLGAKTVAVGNRIIIKNKPGEMIPRSRFGRAHFYAPYKRLGSLIIDTYTFNLVLVWIITFGLYLALYFKLFAKLITGLGNLRLPKAEA